MTQRVVDGLPGPSVPWLWPFRLYPNPHTARVWRAAQGNPETMPSQGCSFWLLS